MIKIIKNPSAQQIVEFENFSNSNWGEHSHDGDPKLDFFDLHRVIFENYLDSKLVSGLVVFFKTLVFSDRIIQIAGIGGVVTHVDHRNKGFALETLKFAIEKLEEIKIDAVMLCTDIEKLGKFYNKVGFVPLGKNYFFVDKLGNLKSEKGGMIADIGNTKAYKYLLETNENILVGLSNF